jgi:hypothetical protein
MDGDETLRIHGAVDPRLKEPIMVERGGRRLRVVSSTPRQDLQLIAWKRDQYRAYRELTLSDGTRLVVCHNLVTGVCFGVSPDA